MAYIADIPLLLFSFLLILNYKRVADLPSWCRQILPVVVKSAGSTAVQVHGLICPGLLHHFGQLGDGSSAGGQQDQLVIASQPRAAAGAAAKPDGTRQSNARKARNTGMTVLFMLMIFSFYVVVVVY